MAKVLVTIFLLLLFSFNYRSYTVSASTNSNATNFILSECRATLYPALCIQCLSSYSTRTPLIKPSHKQLAQAAVSISLSRAQSVAAFLSKLSRMRGINPIEYRATKDCIDNMASTIDQLSLSVKKLGGLNQEFDSYVISGVESWVGAALTFENTCLEGFGSRMRDGKVKVSVRSRVVDCAHVTSNALALVRRFLATATNLP